MFTEDLRKHGAVGEERIAKLLYLSLVSRVLKRPVSVVVKGPSSGGKSFITNSVLSFFPKSAFFELSAMSNKALIYTNESFKHRFLVVAEADGISRQSDYLFRTLLSEGYLRYLVTEQLENKKFEAREIYKEGPTGLLMTTTRVSLHPENETRIVSVTVDDTEKQAKEVLLRLAQETDEKIDFEPWHALQEWIATGENLVTIPFALQLAEMTNPAALRMKRDFTTVLNLIKSHAILHQKNRERTESGAIIATIDDYMKIFDLVSFFIAEATENFVPETIRETVDAVRVLIDHDAAYEVEWFGNKEKYVTLNDLKELLELDKSAAARRVRKAISHGYLNNLSRRNRPAKITLGTPLPEEEDVLPSPEKLQPLAY